MAKCIFCKSESSGFNTKEHILPESLGGGEWAILPGGLFCDGCQNKFGSEIEQQALADYPFQAFRVFFAIPTKKKKAAWLKSPTEGTFRSHAPGFLAYEPPPILEDAVVRGEKTHFRLIAEPMKPEMTCRTLLKMAIEILACESADLALKEEYDPARKYALSGAKDGNWWFYLIEDLALMMELVNQGKGKEGIEAEVFLEINKIAEGAEVFHLRLFYLDLFVPLQPWIGPPEDVGNEKPMGRVFIV